YPASATASPTWAGSSRPSELTVAVEMPPLFSWMLTVWTPSSALSSSVTASTQWLQVMPSMLMVVVLIQISWVVFGGGLLAQQPADGIRGFLDLVLDDPRIVVELGFLGGADHAVSNVVFEQADAHRVQGLVDRGHLGEDVNAVLVLFHHAGDAADLAFDPLQAAQVGVLVRGVGVADVLVDGGRAGNA